MKNYVWSSILAVLVCAVACIPVYAEESNTLIAIGADYWLSGIDAEIQSSEVGAIGSQVNITEDLGHDDTEGIAALKGAIDIPLLPELLISYFAIDGAATQVITRQIIYKGVTYNISDNVMSSYDITHYEALLGFPLINTDEVKFEILAGAKYFEVETSITSLGITQSENVDGPVPVIGVSAGVALPAKFRIEGMARGLTLEIGDIDATLMDIEMALHYDFNRFARVSAGYRYFLIDAEDTKNNDKVDIKFTGPLVSATVSF